MQGLGILVLIVVFFWIIWPSLSRWLKRKAMERTEDYLRSKMGMPPRDKKRRHSRSRQDGEEQGYSYQRQRKNPFGSDRYSDEPLIPKEYAEDVEFTETKDYSETSQRVEPSRKTEIYHESQISDAEYTEIKKSSSK